MNKRDIEEEAKLSFYMRDNSSRFNEEGKKAIYAIIAVAWAISFTNGKFSPTPYVLWSLGLALLYVFVELVYRLLSACFYKYLLMKYYVQSDTPRDAQKIKTRTTFWNHVGQVKAIVLACLLLASFVLMLLAVLSFREFV